MDLLELVQLFALLVVGGGFLSFLATQLIKQALWPSWLKLALSMAMAVVFGLATAWIQGDIWNIVHAWPTIKAEEVLTFGSIIWASAVAWYVVAFRDATWAAKLGAWPTKTTPKEAA